MNQTPHVHYRFVYAKQFPAWKQDVQKRTPKTTSFRGHFANLRPHGWRSYPTFLMIAGHDCEVFFHIAQERLQLQVTTTPPNPNPSIT